MVDPTYVQLTPKVVKMTGSTNAMGVSCNDADMATVTVSNYVYHFVNTGQEVIYIRKTSATALTVTVDSNACDQGFSTEHDVTYQVPAGNVNPKQVFIGPFRKPWFNQTVNAVDECVKITFSGGASDELIAVLKVPQIGLLG